VWAHTADDRKESFRRQKIIDKLALVFVNCRGHPNLGRFLLLFPSRVLSVLSSAPNSDSDGKNQSDHESELRDSEQRFSKHSDPILRE
jgi:hypothetical protein